MFPYKQTDNKNCIGHFHSNNIKRHREISSGSLCVNLEIMSKTRALREFKIPLKKVKHHPPSAPLPLLLFLFLFSHNFFSISLEKKKNFVWSSRCALPFPSISHSLISFRFFLPPPLSFLVGRFIFSVIIPQGTGLLIIIVMEIQHGGCAELQYAELLPKNSPLCKG